MVSVRLNYLHVLLLLRLALVGNKPKSDKELITVAASMLSLTADAIFLKSELANSGTSLIWRVSASICIPQCLIVLTRCEVAYYGLPAAGIISLSLLDQSLTRLPSHSSTSKACQDLSVLVAAVETGALVHLAELQVIGRSYADHQKYPRSPVVSRNRIRSVYSGEAR